MGVVIDGAFDGGNIDVISADDPTDIRLSIRTDAGGQFRQWFCFRLYGGRGLPCRIVIENAGSCSYAKGFQGYRAVASRDGLHWPRQRTRYDGDLLIVELTPETDCVTVAYFAPYPTARLAAFLDRLQERLDLRRRPLGRSIEGRAIEHVALGVDSLSGSGATPVIWAIGRQHPGETMASWWMEGFLGRLADPDDAAARALLARAAVHVVPNMNPDGSVHGYLRTNAAGTNLNRAWAEPTAEASPEVLAVRDAMDGTGVQACLDVHGDEIIPYNFISGFHGVAGADPGRLALYDDFCAALVRHCPDFQVEHGYPRRQPGSADLTICTNQLAHRFGALAMTLEQPFKDLAERPDHPDGWSPQRAHGLGAACVAALAEIAPRL